jgi:hypothetical protein
LNYDDFDFNPKTRSVPASLIRVGQIVLESDEHPVRITRISHSKNGLNLWCRYIWQRPNEPEWLLGYFYSETKLERKR